MKELKNLKIKQEQVLPEQEKNIQEVFKLCPELEQIGDQKQYGKYLETIFPESKFKGIVYHGTKSKERFEKFHTEFIQNARNWGAGTYFGPKKHDAESYEFSGHIVTSLVNIKNPFITDIHWKGYYGYGEFSIPADKKISEYTNGCDSILNYGNLDRNSFRKFNEYIMEYIGGKDDRGLPIYQERIGQTPEVKEIVVDSPDQIHILGSQADLEDFKEFVAH